MINQIIQLPVYTCLILIFLVGCKQEKKDEQDKVKETEISHLDLITESRLGYGNFVSNREILFPLNREISYTGVPENLAVYVVRSFVLQKKQHYYNQFKLGEISEERFQQIQDIYAMDSSQLSDEMPSTELLFLIGTDVDGNRVIIPDSNQNFDFSDDEPLPFDYPLEFIDEDDEEFFEENQEKFLPRVKFNTDYVVRGKVEKRSFIISVNPYPMETEMNFYSDNPNEKGYFLAVSFPKVQFTEFEVGDKSFQLEIANNFLDPFYTSDDVQFIFSQVNDEEVTPLNKIPFQLNDTVNLNQHDFLIESLSDKGSELQLKHLGKNKKPYGSRMGNYFPLSEVLTFEGEKQAFPSTEKEFQLLYFWTLEEKRSLREVPALKEIDTSKVDILGFSVDENAGAANRMQYRREMHWPNYQLAPSSQQSKFNELKLDTYPTYFLLNKKGEIILRSLHLSEVKRKL